MPITLLTTVASITASIVSESFKSGTSSVPITVISQPSATPIAPPKIDRIRLSIKNCIIMSVARAPTALVVVASIIPIKGDTSQRIQNYNGAIPGLVATRAAAGKHVVFLNNNAAFIQDASWASTLMVDNLHPNEAGYAVLGRAFYGAISALLPPGP